MSLHTDQLPVGLIAQLVGALRWCHIEVMGSHPFKPECFYSLSFRSYVSCAHNCDGRHV